MACRGWRWNTYLARMSLAFASAVCKAVPYHKLAIYALFFCIFCLGAHLPWRPSAVLVRLFPCRRAVFCLNRVLPRLSYPRLLEAFLVRMVCLPFSWQGRPPCHLIV